jgi:hypothetical protein
MPASSRIRFANSAERTESDALRVLAADGTKRGSGPARSAVWFGRPLAATTNNRIEVPGYFFDPVLQESSQDNSFRQLTKRLTISVVPWAGSFLAGPPIAHRASSRHTWLIGDSL